MGKRRTNAPHKDRHAGGDSDESEGEDEVVEQPELNQEQLASIKTRKKLIAKRRGPSETAASSFGVTTPYISTCFINKVSTFDREILIRNYYF